MSTPFVLQRRGQFPERAFQSLATQMWIQFFSIAKADTDVAHWLIDANSATIRLSARSSRMPEDADWEPLPPIIVIINGVVERFDNFESDKVHFCFGAWAVAGILGALAAPEIDHKLEMFLTEDRPLAVVTSPIDEGLALDPLVLIWTSQPRFTLARIAANQRAAAAVAKNRPRRQVRKKSILRKARSV